MYKRFITLCTVLLTCTVFATFDPATWLAKQEKLRSADDGVHETLLRLLKEEKTLSKEAQPLFDLYVVYQLTHRIWHFDGRGTDESGPIDGWSRKTADTVLARYKARCVGHFPYYATLPNYALWSSSPTIDVQNPLKPTLLDNLFYLFGDDAAWYTARVTAAQMRSDPLVVIATRIEAIGHNKPDPLAPTTPPNDDDLIKLYPTVDLKPFSSRQRLILHLISESLPPVAHAYVQYEVAIQLLNVEKQAPHSDDPNDTLSHPNAAVALALLDKAQSVITVPSILKDIKHQREIIIRQEFSFRTDTYWHPKTTLAFTYRNLESVTLTFTSKGNTMVQPQTWTITLPKRPLHQRGYATLPFPKTLTKGAYVVTCDPDLRVNKKDDIEITVTDLAVTTLAEQRLLVVNAISGEPVHGAILTGKDKEIGASDASGVISFASLGIKTYYRSSPYTLTYQDDTISGEIHRDYDFIRNLARTVIRGHWFFDRNVYRPSQTVHYQVVFSQVNKASDLYMSKEATGTIIIQSRSRGERKELAKIPFVSNKEGAYAGTFTIPDDIDPCTLDFACQDVPNERNQCEVVFYKRPNFEITLEKPKVVAWGSPVAIGGTAMTYNGTPLVDTNVNLTLSCEYRWGRWYRPWHNDNSELPPPVTIELKTDKTGRFTHTYTPIYPPQSDLDHPVPYSCSLTVTAKATDHTGETHEATQSLYLRTHPIDLSLDADKWQTDDKPISLRLTCNTNGIVRVYPSSVHLDDDDNGKETDTDKNADKNTDKKDDLPPPTWEAPFNGNTTLDIPLKAGNWQIQAMSGPISKIHDCTVLPTQAPYTSEESLYLVNHGRRFYLASKYPDAKIFVDMISKLGVFQSGFMTPGYHEVPYDDILRGGFTISATTTYQGEEYSKSCIVKVPWERELTVKTKTFRKIITPGTEETWEVTVSDPNASALAVVYDAALDAITPYTWDAPFAHLFYLHTYMPRINSTTSDGFTYNYLYPSPRMYSNMSSRDSGIRSVRMKSVRIGRYSKKEDLESPPLYNMLPQSPQPVSYDSERRQSTQILPPGPRIDFSETALWLPRQRLDDGTLRFTFKVPDSLTRWKMMVFAYSKDLSSGTLIETSQARKPLMLSTNLPRFLRIGDSLTLPTKVTNSSEEPLTGTVTLDGKEAQPFALDPSETKTFFWTITAPDTAGEITYTLQATAENYSDGEARTIRILPRTREVEDRTAFALLNTNPTTLALTVPNDTAKQRIELSTDPLLLVEEILPKLVAYPHTCSEQTCAKYYAISLMLMQNPNDLALIAQKERFIDRILHLRKGRQWTWFDGGSPSPSISVSILVTLSRLRKIGIEDERLMSIAIETLSTWDKQIIDAVANPDKAHVYIPFPAYLYARTAFADRLPISDALRTAYAKRIADYQKSIAKGNYLAIQERRFLALGLFRLGGYDSHVTEAMTFLRDSIRGDKTWGIHWPREQSWWNWWSTPLESHVLGMEMLREIAKDDDSVSKALLWLLQNKRMNDWGSTRATTDAIWMIRLLNPSPNEGSVKILKRSILGVFTQPPDLFTPYPDSITDQRSKHVFQEIAKEQTERPTFDQTFDLDPPVYSVTLQRTNPGVTFGGIYTNYQADFSDIKTHGDTGLSIEKRLFLYKGTEATEVAVDHQFQLGDKVEIRLFVRAEQPMSFIHVIDQRPACFEPTSSLSTWVRGGYRTTTDSQTNFFVETLPRGTPTILTYTCFVTNSGTFLSGIATAECMYAPEFLAHTGGQEKVRVMPL